MSLVEEEVARDAVAVVVPQVVDVDDRQAEAGAVPPRPRDAFLGQPTADDLIGYDAVLAFTTGFTDEAKWTAKRAGITLLDRNFEEQ